MLKVSRQPDGSPEIFYSIQGEGINLGKPAVFLRLALCNLSCKWCDTKYTWDWKHYNQKSEIVEMEPTEIEENIRKYECKYLVVTGGEPLIQQKQLLPLLKFHKNRDFNIEVETNGTIVPTRNLISLIDHWTVSPKLSSSGNARFSREVPAVYRFFAKLPSTHFKYIVRNESDIVEVQKIISEYNLTPQKIILMPEATDREGLIERSKWLVEICKSQGYLFSTRLQIILWGNRRGV